MRCRLETNVRNALKKSGVNFIEDGTKGLHGATKHLDFYLPDLDIYIEVCAYYSSRKIEQASRADNVILLQGKKSVDLFCDLLNANN